MISTSEELPPVSAEQLSTLREVGQRWASSSTVRRARSRPLPIDPALGHFSRPPAPTRFGRFSRVEMFKTEAPDELVATERAIVPETRLGQALARAKRLVLGPPLPNTAVVQERMPKLVALPVLGSDLLSSVAYGPEAMLSVLVLAGAAALRLSLPIAAALVLLMIALGLSYRQTIRAYPSGGGSYIVASDNLGRRPGLAAAAGLLTDYVLTVSVSVAAGVDAITSAVPGLAPQAVPIGLGVIAVLLAGNLRGVRQAGSLFAVPTYVFLFAVFLLITIGLAHAAGNGFSPSPAPPLAGTEAVTLLLVLRAFSSGATSMTGIEAVSNAVPAFRPVEWRNALVTLTWMVSLMVIIFSGLVLLIYLDGIVPKPGETVLSQLAHRTFDGGPLYSYTQAATTLILLLAANTAFNDFPRLLFLMAHDNYAPRLFLRVGDRLAFSNGIIALAAAAAITYAAFHGHTDALIPLYAVGVFVAFTLSQTGMVVHWLRRRGAHWRKSIAFNGLGALLSALVGLTAGVTKFTEGAWVILIAIPLLIATCLKIHRYYDTVRKAVSLHAPAVSRGIIPAGQESEETPEEIRHLIIVPVSRLHLASLRALAYAASFALPICAVHLAPDEDEAQRFRYEWNVWGNHVRLETIVNPYRAIVPPLVHYIEALHDQRPDVTLTVVLHEFVARHRWQQFLHSPVAPRLRRALRPLPDIVITTVPFHLGDSTSPTFDSPAYGTRESPTVTPSGARGRSRNKSR
ncbi:MAG TPA: APC family permease [Pseudonocardiaceae bacterium]|nr:APC family permease [Pseudonocardiaceae bacterium]